MAYVDNIRKIGMVTRKGKPKILICEGRECMDLEKFQRVHRVRIIAVEKGPEKINVANGKK